MFSQSVDPEEMKKNDGESIDFIQSISSEYNWFDRGEEYKSCLPHKRYTSNYDAQIKYTKNERKKRELF